MSILPNHALLKKIFLLTVLFPLVTISQVTIKERVELRPVAKSQAASRLVRFLFRSEHQVFLRMYINGGQLYAEGTGSAEVYTYADQCAGFSFNLQERLAEIWDPYLGSAVTFDIYVDGALVRHDDGRITGGDWTIFGIWQDMLYRGFTVPPANNIIISAELASNTLRPLGDNDNKANPNIGHPPPGEPDLTDERVQVINWNRAKPTKLTIRVKDEFGVPVPNVSFWMKAWGCEFSGGHDHVNVVEWHRPWGVFVREKEKDTMVYYYGQTDQNGENTCRYRCSGVGGRDSIEFHLQDPCYIGTRDGFAIVQVEVPQLEELTAGVHYQLIGMSGTPGVRSKHLENHFGTSYLVKMIKQLADNAYAQKNFVLRINDMSLAKGGPFDVDNNFDTPHETHREGVSVDVSYKDANGKDVSRTCLRNLVKNLEGKIQEHGHFHITFR